MSKLVPRESATVSETKKGAVQGIAGAGAVEAVRWVGPTVTTVIVTLWAWLQGLAFPWNVIFGLGVVLVLAIIVNLVASARAKWRKPSADVAVALSPEPGLIESSAPDIQLQEKYTNLAAQLAGKRQQFKEESRRLLDMTEQKNAVYAALTESRATLGQVEQELRVLQSRDNEYGSILPVLKRQAEHLPSLVTVEKVVFTGHRMLSDSDYIELEFRIKNYSVYEISIDEVVGHFSYNTEPFEASPVLIDDAVRDLPFWQTATFTLKQGLTRRESLSILNTPSAIAFHRSRIPIKTTPAITQKHDLHIGFTLERDALIGAYPKLDMVILSAELKSYHDLTENRRFNLPGHLGSVININLEFENPRQRAIDVKQYKLTTHENDGVARTTAAQKGEIRENPAQGVSGEAQGLALPNLYDQQICAEQREPHEGWLQFIVKTHPQNLRGNVADLIIIDADGVEHPAKTGALQYKDQWEHPSL